MLPPPFLVCLEGFKPLMMGVFEPMARAIQNLQKQFSKKLEDRRGLILFVQEVYCQQGFANHSEQ